MQQQQRQRPKRRRLNHRGIILIILLLATIAAIVYFAMNQKVEAVSFMQQMPFGANAPYVYTGNGFLYTSGNNLFYYDLKTEDKNWQVQLTVENCKVNASESIIAVFTDKVMQAIDFSGQSLFNPQEFSGEIVNVKCGKNLIAVLKKDASKEYQIYLFSSKGEKVNVLNFESETPMSYGFYGNGDDLWTLAVNTNSKNIVSTVTTFNSGDAITGKIQIDSQIVTDVLKGNNLLYLFGTTDLMTFNPAGKRENSTLIYGWSLCDYELIGSKPSFLLRQQNPDEQYKSLSTAKLFTLGQETEYPFELPANCIDVFIGDNQIIVVTPDALIIYNNNGTVKSTYPLTPSVSGVKKLSLDKLLMMSGGNAYLLPVG